MMRVKILMQMYAKILRQLMVRLLALSGGVTVRMA
jgi:hypothetical protein